MTRRPIALRNGDSRFQARAPARRTIGGRFSARSDGDRAEITLYEDIGFWGVTAAAMRRELDDIDAAEILLRINSLGGDVFDGIAIYNDLLDHPARVSVEITGIAASIASIIAMAGDEIAIADNGFMMIHNAWTIALGDRNEFRAVADILERIDGSLAGTYAARTGAAKEEISAMMDAETWMTGVEAVEAKFADRSFGADSQDAGEDAAAALFDLSVFAHAPAALKRRTEAGMRAAGFSKREARAAVANGFDDLPRLDAAIWPPRRDAGAADDALIEGVDALTAIIRAAAG